MRKILSIIAALIILASVGITCAAEDAIKVVLDGKPLTFDDAAPVIINDRTMVPMRKIFTSLDEKGVIGWDDLNKQVTAYCKDKLIVLTINDPEAYIDGQKYMLDSPAVIINDRTMVPLRFVAESTGASVEWDKDTRTVTINSNGIYSKTVFYKECPNVPSLENAIRVQPKSVKDENGKVTYTYSGEKINYDSIAKYCQVLSNNGFTVGDPDPAYDIVYTKLGTNVGIKFAAPPANANLTITIYEVKLEQ